MHTLHLILETVVNYLVIILEAIGIFIIFWSSIRALGEYIQNTFMRKHFALQTHLAKGLALALEFKLGAEILKTVLVQEIDELIVLGAVFALRALMSILIHFELKNTHDD